MLCPPFACGQWLLNCLSYSQHLVPCAPTETIEYLLACDGLDRQGKHLKMLQHLPKGKKDSGWHYGSEFYDSIRWLHHHEGTGITMEDGEEPGELLFQNVTREMRSYMNQFWRRHAVLVSNSPMGFMMKLHYGAEADGFKNLVPHAKKFTIENYRNWQDIFANKSRSGPGIVEHWRSKDHVSDGFVFDLDLILKDEQGFKAQMRLAYEYHGLDDYSEVEADLLEYRRAYLKANLQYTK